MPETQGLWSGRTFMNAAYIVAGVVVVALLVYLFVALLRPEWFE
jgi:K+-transporting ATPase KdpF subunit